MDTKKGTNQPVYQTTDLETCFVLRTKKLSKYIFFLCAALTPLSALATVHVSEIMYDVSGADTGREWIEVVNQGPTAIDLTTYKLFEGGVNHKIVATAENKLLAAGAVAIIADNPTKFLSDWPNASGTLFDSAFSLSNTGETLVIKDADLMDQDSVSYAASEAAGNGLSLSRGDNSTLVASTPTPGVYVAAPVHILPAAPTKPETSVQKPALQPKAQKSSQGTDPAPEVQSTHEDVPITEKETGARKTSAAWIWALGALGLSLLGVGSVYALKLQTPSGTAVPSREDAHRAMQKEADSYEIIES